MNPNEYFKDNPEEKWKYLCFRFIGRSRRLEKFKAIKRCPEMIIEREKELIQTSYDEMREACMSDEGYLKIWESKQEENNSEVGGENT